MVSTSSLQDIEACLGAPDGSGEDFLLYHGDCTELMRLLPSETFDLTVTSPPYNIGKEYESVLPLDEYLDWCGGWIADVHRLTRPAGAFWLNLGYMPLRGRAKAIPIPCHPNPIPALGQGAVLHDSRGRMELRRRGRG